MATERAATLMITPLVVCVSTSSVAQNEEQTRTAITVVLVGKSFDEQSIRAALAQETGLDLRFAELPNTPALEQNDLSKIDGDIAAARSEYVEGSFERCLVRGKDKQPRASL